MNFKTFSFIGTLVLGVSISAQAAGIYDVKNKKDITHEELLTQLDQVDQIIVGEKHFDPIILNESSSILIDWQVRKHQPVTFAWEFLNWSDQLKVQAAFQQVKTGEISAYDFIIQIFGADADEIAYVPMISAAAFAQADILAVNLSRTEKAPVVANGISALDPKLLPNGFALGSQAYRDRFVAAMGGHGDPAKIQNYFEAQCLVDDVIAYHLTQSAVTPLSFLLIGDFHSSYFDGVMARLSARDGVRKRALIQFVENKSEATDATYGDVADYVFYQQ